MTATARRAPNNVDEDERHDGRFGERIKRMRLQQAMTQTEVARLAGISGRTYSDWERGLHVPFPGRALRGIATALRVSPAFLLLGDEEGMHGER